MKIYGSTEWVDPSKEKEWYALEVINMWDWSTDPVCFGTLSGGNTIPYCLKRCTSMDSTTYSTERVLELTEEMKQELQSMGYSLK